MSAIISYLLLKLINFGYYVHNIYIYIVSTFLLLKYKLLFIDSFLRYEPGRHKKDSKKYCRYNQNKGYVVFSAMGSFFIPLTVMLYVYLKIGYVLTSRRQHIVRDAVSFPSLSLSLIFSLSIKMYIHMLFLRFICYSMQCFFYFGVLVTLCIFYSFSWLCVSSHNNAYLMTRIYMLGFFLCLVEYVTFFFCFFLLSFLFMECTLRGMVYKKEKKM